VKQVCDAVRSMWNDTCTVYEYRPILKENKTTVHEEIAVTEETSCRLSFSKLHHANQTDTAAKRPQTVKLFLDESVEINAGSKIVVSRGGRKFVFGYSGEAGVFDHHQEIILVPWEGWAM